MLELEEDSLVDPEEIRSGVSGQPRESLGEDSDRVDSVLETVKDRFKFESPSYFSVNVDKPESPKELTWFKIRSIQSIHWSRKVQMIGIRSVEVLNHEEGYKYVDKTSESDLIVRKSRNRPIPISQLRRTGAGCSNRVHCLTII